MHVYHLGNKNMMYLRLYPPLQLTVVRFLVRVCDSQQHMQQYHRQPKKEEK